MSGGLIGHNKGKGGDTEDIVSVYQSDNVTVEDNQFEGTNWSSPSGPGIALSDGGGSFNVAQRNILVNPGQVGIFIAGGDDNKILDNIVYGAQRTYSNVGLYVWNQSSSPCSTNEVPAATPSGGGTRRVRRTPPGTQATAARSQAGRRIPGVRRST